MNNDKVSTLPADAKHQVLKMGGKILSGKVVSIAMNKTVVIDVERSKTHRLYGKSFKINTKIKARNDFENIAIGDEITIAETRPISKDVTFKVIKAGIK